MTKNKQPTRKENKDPDAHTTIQIAETQNGLGHNATQAEAISRAEKIVKSLEEGQQNIEEEQENIEKKYLSQQAEADNTEKAPENVKQEVHKTIDDAAATEIQKVIRGYLARKIKDKQRNKKNIDRNYIQYKKEHLELNKNKYRKLLHEREGMLIYKTREAEKEENFNGDFDITVLGEKQQIVCRHLAPMWINLQQAAECNDIKKAQKFLSKEFIQNTFLNKKENREPELKLIGDLAIKYGIDKRHDNLDNELKMRSWNGAGKRNRCVYCDNSTLGQLLMIVASKLNNAESTGLTISTGCHMMGMFIKKQGKGYSIKFYDPNRSNQHIRIVCDSLERIKSLKIDHVLSEYYRTSYEAPVEGYIIKTNGADQDTIKQMEQASLAASLSKPFAALLLLIRRNSDENGNIEHYYQLISKLQESSNLRRLLDEPMFPSPGKESLSIIESAFTADDLSTFHYAMNKIKENKVTLTGSELVYYLQKITQYNADWNNKCKPSHWLEVSKCLLDNTEIDHTAVMVKLLHKLRSVDYGYSASWILDLLHVPEEKKQDVINNVSRLYLDQVISKYFKLRGVTNTKEYEEKVFKAVYMLESFDCKTEEEIYSKLLSMSLNVLNHLSYMDNTFDIWMEYILDALEDPTFLENNNSLKQLVDTHQALSDKNAQQEIKLKIYLHLLNTINPAELSDEHKDTLFTLIRSYTGTKEEKQPIIETRLNLVFNELKDKYDIQGFCKEYCFETTSITKQQTERSSIATGKKQRLNFQRLFR